MQLTHLTGQRNWICTEILLNCCFHDFRMRFAMYMQGCSHDQGRFFWGLHSSFAHQEWNPFPKSVWFELIHVFPTCFSSSRSPTTTCLPFWTRGILNSQANGTTCNKCPYTGMVNSECWLPGTAEVYCLQLVLILMYHRSNSGSIEAEI